MAGKSSKRDYFAYMSALAPIYKEMERILKERPSSPILQYFDHRVLDRSDHIETDLGHLSRELGYQGSKNDIRLRTTDAYLDHLTTNITDARLLAHHYIRYLGDLSGGRIIGRMMQKHYSLSSETMNFYNFEGVGDPVFYKRRYRDLLNLVPLTDSEREEFIDEVVLLYKMTREIFEELEKYSGEVQAN